MLTWMLNICAGESLNTDYLTPYLNSLGPNFSNGANFAIIGSATLPRYVPFSLFVQVSQFLRFRSRSPALMLKGTFLHDPGKLATYLQLYL